MCTTGKGVHNIENELTTEDWKKIIINLNKECKPARIIFGGGEPLIREDIAEIIKFTCSTDVANVTFITNGILLNEEFMNKFDKNELGKMSVNFSIDGLEYEHNFIRGTGVFQKMFKSFEMVYHDYFKPRRIKDLVINSILMPENFRNYVDFLEYFKKYEGVRVDIQPVIPNNEIFWFTKYFMLTDLEKNKLHEIVTYVENNPDQSCRHPLMVKSYIKFFNNELLKGQRCAAGRGSLNITLEGNTFLCGKEILMPLHKFSFKDVFYSDEYQNEMKRIDVCEKPCLQGLQIGTEDFQDKDFLAKFIKE
jgi:MoaA/NifB/PqqE/SkfB family radical SAM enzyme